MSVQSEINSRTAALQAILAGANDRITAKRGKAAPNLRNLPTAIDSISLSDSKLQSKIVTPTGQEFTVNPDGGYDGLTFVTVKGDGELIPENIKSGVEIYGVTGTHEGYITVASADELPANAPEGTIAVVEG